MISSFCLKGKLWRNNRQLYAFHPWNLVEAMAVLIFSYKNVSTLRTPGGTDMPWQFLLSSFLQKSQAGAIWLILELEFASESFHELSDTPPLPWSISFDIQSLPRIAPLWLLLFYSFKSATHHFAYCICQSVMCRDWWLARQNRFFKSIFFQALHYVFVSANGTMLGVKST